MTELNAIENDLMAQLDKFKGKLTPEEIDVYLDLIGAVAREKKNVTRIPDAEQIEFVQRDRSEDPVVPIKREPVESITGCLGKQIQEEVNKTEPQQGEML